MSEEVNERLREKTMQIVSLNQKMEALQAQLSGSQRRANELGIKVTELQSSLTQKDSEIQMLQTQLSTTKGALDTVGKEMQGIKAEQTQLLAKKKPESVGASLKDELTLAEMTIGRLREDLKQFSHAATAVLNQEDGALDKLKEVLLEVGDPKYRILNMVLSKKSIRMEEIASSLVIDMTSALKHVDALQAAGEVQIRDGNTVLPAQKYLELKVPKDVWASMEPTEIFQELEEFVGKTDDKASIVDAMETAVEILEQKLARSGALIFQMRRTSEAWKRSAGSVEELQYTIKDWKGRAQALG
jgi:chromosome segregation ATPase